MATDGDCHARRPDGGHDGDTVESQDVQRSCFSSASPGEPRRRTDCTYVRLARPCRWTVRHELERGRQGPVVPFPSAQARWSCRRSAVAPPPGRRSGPAAPLPSDGTRAGARASTTRRFPVQLVVRASARRASARACGRPSCGGRTPRVCAAVTPCRIAPRVFSPRCRGAPTVPHDLRRGPAAARRAPPGRATGVPGTPVHPPCRRQAHPATGSAGRCSPSQRGSARPPPRSAGGRQPREPDLEDLHGCAATSAVQVHAVAPQPG